MSNVVIFGTASFAEVVHFYLSNDSDHKVVAFTAHRDRISKTSMLGLPVVPFEDIKELFPPEKFKMFVAVGYKQVNMVRAGIYFEVKSKGYDLISYVSRKCTNWSQQIGDNCFIFEDNTIQPFVTIGNNVTLWSGNHIGHHSTIGHHCFISSHVVISGHVKVGDYSFIGVNATTRDNIEIGSACVIGAGALIMKSTKEKEVYIAERTMPAARKSDEIGF